jgi:hypothetical protein
MFANSGCIHGQHEPASELPDSPGIISNLSSSSVEQLADTSDDMPDAMSERIESTITPDNTRAPYLHRVVKAGAGPQPLTAKEKFEMSFRSRLSIGAFGSSLFGAGERHLFNSRPHYGTDSAGFGERLGAAELKQATESFFSYGLYAAAFREDPHYYRMGPQTGYVQRGIYSASRVFLTRTDSGQTSVNWAKLAGMASATALTNTYYPDRDRSVRQSMEAYGSSLASSALTLELHEFMPDVISLIRHRKKPAN